MRLPADHAGATLGRIVFSVDVDAFSQCSLQTLQDKLIVSRHCAMHVDHEVDSPGLTM